MALQIRRGTDAQRQTIRFNAGELVYTTDYKDLFVGDGTTNGGVRIAPLKTINGLTGAATDGALTITTDNITAGATNKYYSSTQARIDAGAALIAGNAGNTGISFTYHSGDNSITAVVTAGGYSLPTASPTDLGGVKISQGGLAIDGAGLLRVTTPVSTGVVGHLTYYTGTNAVGDTGTGLTWATSNARAGTGGWLTVNGLLSPGRVSINSDLTYGGIYVATQSNGDADYDLFTLYSSHAETTPSAMRMFRTKGTVASPATVASGDNIFDIQFVGGTGPTGAGIAAQIRATVTGTVSSNVVPGGIVLSAANTSGTLVDSVTIKSTDVTFATRAKFPDGTASAPSIAFTTDGGVDTGFSHPEDGVIVVSSNTTEVARFDGGGIRSAGFIKVAEVSGSLPSPAEAGMIVLDGGVFKGYTGSGWVDLN